MSVAFYFKYPKTAETADLFLDWKCSACHEENPELFGGTFAHEGEGSKHPIHRECVIALSDWKPLCPDCTASIDVTSVMTSAEKSKHAIKQILYSCAFQARNFAGSPVTRVYAGLGCMVVGFLLQKNPLISLGFGLQTHGVDQAIRLGSHHILLLRRVKCIVDQLSLRFSQKSFEELKTFSEFLPRYSSEMLLSLDVRVLEKIKCELLAHQILCHWRWGALAGAIYFGSKNLPALESHDIKYLLLEVLLHSVKLIGR